MNSGGVPKVKLFIKNGKIVYMKCYCCPLVVVGDNFVKENDDTCVEKIADGISYKSDVDPEKQQEEKIQVQRRDCRYDQGGGIGGTSASTPSHFWKFLDDKRGGERI